MRDLVEEIKDLANRMSKECGRQDSHLCSLREHGSHLHD